MSEQIQSGIYMWRNNITGRVLVGQTQNFKKRFAGYKSKLRRGVYTNTHLQNSWNKYGESNFEFLVLELVPNFAHLTSFEQKFLDYYRTMPAGVYNQSGPVSAPRRGSVVSDEHKAKNSIALKGRPKPAGFGEAVSKRQLGQKLSRERVEKSIAANKNRKLPEAHKNKIRATLKGRPRPREVMEKMWAAGTKHLCTTVERIDCITGEVKEYSSIKSVKDDGFSPSCVSQVCRGLRTTHKNFAWLYLEDLGGTDAIS